MLLLGPRKSRISQILVIVLKSHSDKICINEIPISQELPVLCLIRIFMEQTLHMSKLTFFNLNTNLKDSDDFLDR